MQSWIHMMMGRFVAGLGVGNLSVGKSEDLIHAAEDLADIIQVFLCSNQSAVPVRSVEQSWHLIS